uniref:Uncharacterized protein n=1 Tax=Phaeocystis antarctica TaxID=33657 RepID=A0A7S0NG98_9EUKA
MSVHGQRVVRRRRLLLRMTFGGRPMGITFGGTEGASAVAQVHIEQWHDHRSHVPSLEEVAMHRTCLSVAREALCHGALVRERTEGVYVAHDGHDRVRQPSTQAASVEDHLVVVVPPTRQPL